MTTQPRFSGHGLNAACVGLLLITASACSARTPADLAALVLSEQLATVPAEFVACVSVDGRDADESLLDTLRKPTRTVVPASECDWVLDTSRGSYERKSGRKAMLIDVKAYLARDEVEYVARHHGLYAIMLTLRVKEEDRKWKIVGVLKHVEA